MNSLTPFIHHDMDNLPNQARGRAKPAHSDSWQVHCLPSRQKNAASFLNGETPGLQKTLTPQSALHPDCQQDSETVLKLLEWREEAPYG